MDEDACLDRYGVHPADADLDAVRQLLAAHTARERQAQGGGDTELMRLCCVQLFNAGGLDDVLLIWKAKTASTDADCSIDIQLLCGTGLAGTKAYLRSLRPPEAAAALQRLLDCEQAGDFEDFSVAGHAAQYAAYYTP
ncbi:hypothetical protein U5640_03375 [Streptomyces sp. SS7]|uniref:hypothetical protein n=1 Tax=Streptomyces sp. SS7 TaxID=3108485 RepID=UPI0030EC2EE4